MPYPPPQRELAPDFSLRRTASRLSLDVEKDADRYTVTDKAGNVVIAGDLAAVEPVLRRRYANRERPAGVVARGTVATGGVPRDLAPPGSPRAKRAAAELRVRQRARG